MSNEFGKKLKNFIIDKGADLVGFANVERFEEAPEGCKPQDVLPKAKSVISLAKHIPDGVVDSLPSASYQAQGYIVLSGILNQLTFEVAIFLEKCGYKSLPMPASYSTKERRIIGDWPNLKLYMLSTFSHRHSAEKAGLGHIGRNNILITPMYGPRVRLSSIITAAPLEPDPMLEENLCICKRCPPIEKCPVEALGEYATDHYKCFLRHSFVVNKGDPDFEKKDREVAQRLKNTAKKHPLEISAELLGHVNYGATLCGICLRECVVGIQSAKRRLK